MVVSAIIIVIIIQTLYGEEFMPITLFHYYNAFKLNMVIFSVIVIVIMLYVEKFMLITLFQLS